MTSARRSAQRNLHRLAEQRASAGDGELRDARIGRQLGVCASHERAFVAARPDRDDAAGLEPEIGRLNRGSIPDERRGDDEEEQRDGDLAGHEDPAERRALDAAASPGLAARRSASLASPAAPAAARRGWSPRPRRRRRRGIRDSRSRAERSAPARRPSAEAARRRRTRRGEEARRPAPAQRALPAMAMSSPSVTSWRTIRPRLAPIERRMPISRWRAFARASMTFDALAHAATSTSPNAANTGDRNATSSRRDPRRRRLRLEVRPHGVHPPGHARLEGLDGERPLGLLRRDVAPEPRRQAQLAGLIAAEEISPRADAVHRERRPQIPRRVVEADELRGHDADDDQLLAVQRRSRGRALPGHDRRGASMPDRSGRRPARRRAHAHRLP